MNRCLSNRKRNDKDESMTDNASSSDLSSEFSHQRKRHKVSSILKSSSEKHSTAGPFFPKGGLPLQSKVSDEPIRVLCNFDDAQDTNTVVISFIAANEETRATLLLNINEIIDRFDTSSVTLDTVRELVILGRIPVWSTFLRITQRLLKAIEDSKLLQTTALQGLAVVLNLCPEEIDMKGKEGFYSDILALLQTRLDNARTTKNEGELIPLLNAIIALLNAMRYREVGKLDSGRIFNPLKSSLGKLDSHKNTTVRFLTSYANQILLHVGNNESLEKSIFRHGLLAIRIVVDIASGIKNVDLGKFESAFQSIMNMNDFSIKASWYKGLVLLDSTIYVQDWTKFEELILMSNLKSNEYFLQGACLRLEQIAITHPNQGVRDGAIKFLRYILEKSSDNTQHVAFAALGRLGISHCAIHNNSNIKRHTVSTTCSCTVLQNAQNDLPAIWDLSWHSKSTAILLKCVQQERQSHMKIKDTATNVVEMRGDLNKLVDSTTSLCNLDEVRHALEVYYKDSLKVLRVSGDELDLDSCYVNLAIVEASSQRKKEKSDLESKARAFQRMPSRGESTNVNMELSIPLEQLFDKRRLRDGNKAAPKRILIYGRAGVGKSTLCKKIVRLFQDGKWRDKFDAIIWLPLRHIKDCNFHTISDMLSKWYFASQSDSAKLSRTLQNSKVLFILDGLDEIVATLRSNHNLMEFFKVLIQQEHVLITSRPSGVDKYILTGIDLEMETVGFSPQNVKDYLSIVLPPDQVQSVQKFIDQTPVVQGLVNIPVQLDVICFSWDSLPTNNEVIAITDLYQAMVCKFCRKDAFKLQKKSDGEVLSEIAIENLLPCQIDELMDSELEYLSYLAFEGLRDNHRIEFDEQWLATIFLSLDNHKKLCQERRLPTQLVSRLKETSFLHSTDIDLNVNVRNFKGCWHFLHLTFQEYFAASWLVRSLQGNSSGGAGSIFKEFMMKGKYNPRYEIVWWMVAGQLKGSALVLFFEILQEPPLDLIGGYHHHLLAACLNESRSELDKVDQGRLTSLESQLTEWLRFEKTSFDRFIGDKCRSILGSTAYLPEELLVRSIGQSEVSLKYLIQTLERRATITISSIQILVNALQDKDSNVRASAASTLRRQSILPDSALQALIGALRDKDWSVRNSAASALGKQSPLPDSSRRALIGALQDEDWNVRKSAASALGKQSPLPNSDLRALINASQEMTWHFRYSATPKLRKQLTLPNSSLRDLINVSQEVTWHFGYPSVPALRKQLTLPDSSLRALIGALQDKDWNVRESAASALGKQLPLPDSSLRVLIGALQDEDWHVRYSAASALGKQLPLPDSSLRALIGALQDKNWHVRYSAASALGKQLPLPDSSLRALVGALQDKSWYVRYSAAFALEKQSKLPDSSLRALAGALQDKNCHVMYSSAFALGNQSTLPDSTLQDLIGALKDNNCDVRYAAAFALGKQLTLPDSALRALVGALQDKTWDVRHLAATILGSQSTLSDSALQAFTDALQNENWHVRSSAASALGNQPILPGSTLRAFIDALRGGNRDVSFPAASVLGNQLQLPDSVLQFPIRVLPRETWFTGMPALPALVNQSTLPASAIQGLIGALEVKNDNRNVLRVLEQHAKSVFMAIPELFPSSIETLYSAFLVHYCSQNSATLWFQDNQLFFYTAQGFGKVYGLSMEVVEEVVAVFEAVRKVSLKNN